MVAAVFGYNKVFFKFVLIIVFSLTVASCVTETTEVPSMKFTDTAVIAVQDPSTSIQKGSTFSWLPEAVRFYNDERLQNTPVKAMIENEIIKNIEAKEMKMAASGEQSKYAIAYTAALESSLEDSVIVQRYGLLPGNSQIPQDDKNVEKGSLIIYVFDNTTNDVIWRSAAQVGVHFEMPAEQRKERMQRIIAEMFQTLKVN